MGRCGIGRAFAILFTLELCSVSLHATPQSFGPLIRDRAIRPQTSEEDLNANIERIFRKDFKAKDDPGNDELEQAPTEIVGRSNIGSNQRRKKPIDNSDQNVMLSVVRDPEGKLRPVFGSTTTRPAPSTVGHLVTKADEQAKPLFVLKADQGNIPAGELRFRNESYPPDYPFEQIFRILAAKRPMYREAFIAEPKREALVPRVDSPTDKAICESTTEYVYPTYHPESKLSIINVEGFFQEVVIERCSNPGAVCSKIGCTEDGKTLVCEQQYTDHGVFVMPVNKLDQFERQRLSFPTSCKCIAL